MKICIFPECNTKALSLGYCDKHYRRFKKYGDANIKHIFIPKSCNVEGCLTQSRIKGLCDKHYRRLRKNGTTDLVVKTLSCSIESCNNRHVAKGLCRKHYEMKRQNIIINPEAQKLIDSHNGLCNICGSDTAGFGRKGFCIDHDHKTGKVRGLLCQKCNIGLGNFNDSPDLLKKAIDYLKNSSDLI